MLTATGGGLSAPAVQFRAARHASVLPVTRDDIEAKLRAIQTDVVDRVETRIRSFAPGYAGVAARQDPKDRQGQRGVAGEGREAADAI